MSTLTPRVVLVTRETDYERLVGAHATRAQTAFVLQTRQQSLSAVESAHQRFLPESSASSRHSVDAATRKTSVAYARASVP